jgi:hypothetical protein
MSERICSIEDCDSPAKTRGWCYKHYGAWRRHGDPTVDKSRHRGPCSIEGCPKRSRKRGWCEAHYQKWRKYGDPLAQVIAPRGAGSWERGYRILWMPDHPLARANGHVAEHRLVAYEAGLLTDLTDEVHHINGIKDDNRIENLQVMTRAEHMRLHRLAESASR